MISMFCGVPGSGKSTGLAWVARRATTRPERPIYLCGSKIADAHPTVYTNFPFPGCYQLDFDTLGRCDYKDCLIIVDEASMYADSRDYKNFSKSLQFAVTQGRKSSVDYIFCSQQYDDLDKKIRNLTVNLYHFVSLPFSFFKVTHIDPFFGIENARISSGYEWGRSQFIYGKPLFKLFDSYSPIKSPNLLPPPLIPWDSSPADPKNASTTTPPPTNLTK